MYRKHPEKLMGESYSGREPLYAAITITTFFLSLLMGLLIPAAFYLALISLALFFVAYSTLLAFVAKKEARMLPLAVPLIFLRTLAWLSGFVWGLLKASRGSL